MSHHFTAQLYNNERSLRQYFATEFYDTTLQQRKKFTTLVHNQNAILQRTKFTTLLYNNLQHVQVQHETRRLYNNDHERSGTLFCNNNTVLQRKKCFLLFYCISFLLFGTQLPLTSTTLQSNKCFFVFFSFILFYFILFYFAPSFLDGDYFGEAVHRRKYPLHPYRQIDDIDMVSPYI